MELPSGKLEAEIRQLLAGGTECREALNELLRDNEEARPMAARILAEEAALIGVLRTRQSAEWAASLEKKVLELPNLSANKRVLGLPPFAWLAVAACLTLLAVIIVDRPQTDQPTTAEKAEPEFEFIGLVSALESRDGSFEIGAKISPGELVLGEQKMRIDLYNGVKLSISGPARLDIKTESCRLWHGELGVDTGLGALTYPVQTTLGRFVDQGTVFTVAVLDKGRTELSVREGKVFAELLTGEGDVISRQAVDREKGLVLGKPDGEFQMVDAVELGHQPLLPLEDSSLEVPTSYRELVHTSEPMILWDFEDESSTTSVANKAGSNFSGLIEGTVAIEGEIGRNQYAVFGQYGSAGAIISTEQLVRIDDAPLTIEFWFRPDRIQHGHLLNFGVHGQPDPFLEVMPVTPLSALFIEVTAGDGHKNASTLPSLRAGFRTPPCLNGHSTPPGGTNMNLYRAHYALGKWTHLVARIDGEEFAMFENGILVAREPLSSWDRGSMQKLQLMVGKLDNTPRTNPIRPFAGAIDEIVVYERALGDDEIRRHFEAMNVPD